VVGNVGLYFAAYRYGRTHQTLLTKPIDFGTLRNEIDMRVERAA